MTNKTWFMAALVAACGVAAPAFAQDSVSSTGAGLPGDALDPWTPAQLCAGYVVNMTPFQSSTGTMFAIAPIVKASKVSPTFFSSLVSGQSISNTQLTGVPYAMSSYSAWSMAGQGVHPTNNSAGQPVNPAGLSNQFAVGFAEFGSTPSRANNVIGALVNYSPSDPNELFVKRVSAATNVPSSTGGDFSQFGFGSVDATGNLHFRADAFGSTGLPTTSRLGGGGSNQNNIFRVAMQDRDCGTINLIDNAGGADSAATDRPVNNQVLARNTPSCIPQSIAGRPVYIGSRFGASGVAGALNMETIANTFTESTAHFGSLAADHRGNQSFSNRVLFSGSVGTAAILGKSIARGGLSGSTDTLLVWGVDADGNVTATRPLVAPDSMSDTCDQFTLNQNWATAEFDGYRSQIAFRGGNGHVAIGRDQAGRALAAAVVYDSITTGTNNPCNHIAVARFDPTNPNSPVEWKLAAWLDCNTVTGKPLLGPGGQAIGQLTALSLVTGGTPQGPSMSPPAIDSVGNIYFVSAVEIFDPKGGPSDFDTGLVRAVYNPVDFCYDLELLFDAGSVFAGMNSDRDYQVRFLGIANQAGGLSSGAFFSNNVIQSGWNNADVSDMAPSDPLTLGGLIVSAGIVYDANDDGMFNDPTGAGGVPGSPDEAYNVLLFVGAVGGAAGTPCPADLNGDGFVNSSDLALLLGAWGVCPGCPQDLSGDGVVNSSDLALLLGAWGSCPQ